MAENLAAPVARFAAKAFWPKDTTRALNLISSEAPFPWEKALRDQLSLSIAQVAERLIARLPGSRASRDVRSLFPSGVESATSFLFRRYPGLMELWSRQIENWASFASDFARDAGDFVSDVEGKDPQRSTAIRRLQTGLSDFHDGNRSVISVEFACLGRWLYKPRSGESEISWFRLLDWVNSLGFPEPFAVLRVVSKNCHSWMEAASTLPVTSRQEARAYYFRAGGLLYLADMMRMVDLHAGNLIASNSQPIVVDCETILHPNTRLPQIMRRRSIGLLRTGLLPSKGADDGEISALGRMIKGNHLLLRHGRAMRARSFAPSICAGFKAMHILLEERRRTVARRVADLRPDNTRRIYRPTRHYAQILWQSYAPHLIKSSIERTAFLREACMNSVTPRAHINAEVSALQNGDIPIFLGPPAKANSVLSERGLKRALVQIKSAFVLP